MDDDLIICTRNRPEDLRACLETVVAQTAVPTQVTVVDSSDDDRSLQVVAELADRWPAGSAVVHRRAEAGLVRQRVAGLAATRNAIVHFVDDDTRLEPGYVAAIRRVFAQEPGIGGVGGFLTNQPERGYRRIDVWLGLDSPREGVVLPSGRSVRVYKLPGGGSGTALIEVDWIPGCAMSYRRHLLEVEPPNPAVGSDRNGEDVELSYRVRQRTRLVVCPDARIVHLESSAGRRRVEETARVELVSRWERVRAGTGRLSRRAFWVSAWGQLLWYGLKGVVTASRARLGIAAATGRGIRDIRRLGRAKRSRGG